MNKIPYLIHGNTLRSHDAALLDDTDDPREALVESAIQTISTEVYVAVGDVEMHLAGWQDPDHWAEDWAAKLEVDVDDVDEAVAGLLASVITAQAPLPLPPAVDA